MTTLLGLVRSKALHLRSPILVDRPRYVVGQLYLAAIERRDVHLVNEWFRKLRYPDAQDRHPVPLWTSYRADPSAIELGSHGAWVEALAVTGDGRVVDQGDRDGRVLVWNCDRPGAPPVDLGQGAWVGYHGITAMVAVDTSFGDDDDPDWFAAIASGGRIRMWALDEPEEEPDTVGPDDSEDSFDDDIHALAYLPDRELLVSGDTRGRILVWDLIDRASPTELGRHEDQVEAVIVLHGDQVVSGGGTDRSCSGI